MDQDDPAEALTELREKRLGLLDLLQAAAGSGLAVYTVWALLLQPGFRRVPLRLQVPYIGASARQVENVLSLLRGRPGKMVDLGSGDGRIVSLRDCHNVSVFLAPSVLPLLEDKLQVELPAGARVVSGRFPLPTWKPVAVVGEGTDRVWAYDVHGAGPAVSSSGVPIKAIPESSST
ncbi:adenine nucleotide translocase lysine N-methyltransferase isoform X2 [Rattus rattus]|uniref:adenine nucleotide translocase lysine N-methyltransferase isoform X2 n=1 Tax=Rattus rattus TaxID=10117 RepID=UPI0013F39F77|nr:adenine nucleotide translocase lysine N-methyltransferase isoform X2 [Rattus rattus]